MDNRFEVTVAAGTLMSGSGTVARFPHRWTPAGVTAEAEFTGGHLLHLAVAGCVLNDLYREAAALGIDLNGARVTAAGGFDAATWHSTGTVRPGGQGGGSALMPALSPRPCKFRWKRAGLERNLWVFL